MKKFMIIGIGLSLFGFGFEAPTAQAVERTSITLDQAYQQSGSRNKFRRGVARITRANAYRSNRTTTERTTRDLTRRRSNSITPFKRSKSDFRNQNKQDFADVDTNLQDFYRRPRYLRR